MTEYNVTYVDDEGLTKELVVEAEPLNQDEVKGDNIKSEIQIYRCHTCRGTRFSIHHKMIGLNKKASTTLYVCDNNRHITEHNTHEEILLQTEEQEQEKKFNWIKTIECPFSHCNNTRFSIHYKWIGDKKASHTLYVCDNNHIQEENRLIY